MFNFYHFRGFHVILVIIKVLRGICVFGGLECILVILDILKGIFVILEVLLGIFFKEIFNGILILIFFLKKNSGVFRSFWTFKYCFEGTMVFLKIFAIFFFKFMFFWIWKWLKMFYVLTRVFFLLSEKWFCFDQNFQVPNNSKIRKIFSKKGSMPKQTTLKNMTKKEKCIVST